MLSIRHEILTYKPYRIVCDSCEWESDSYELLSQAASAMNKHNRSAHVRNRAVSVPPTRPISLVRSEK
jgi:hypothetical protein